MTRKLHRVPEAAEALNVSQKCIWNWIAQQKIAVTRIYDFRANRHFTEEQIRYAEKTSTTSSPATSPRTGTNEKKRSGSTPALDGRARLAEAIRPALTIFWLKKDDSTEDSGQPASPRPRNRRRDLRRRNSQSSAAMEFALIRAFRICVHPHRRNSGKRATGHPSRTTA